VSDETRTPPSHPHTRISCLPPPIQLFLLILLIVVKEIPVENLLFKFRVFFRRIISIMSKASRRRRKGIQKKSSSEKKKKK
jgi:hypothetical protein